MTSIILNTFDPTRVQRHMTQQCIACLYKYTESDFELILVDNEPTMGLYHEYDLYPRTYIEVTPKKNVYECYNLGARHARGDKLLFIQNDVFVHERAVDDLAIYLDNWDVAYPQQYPISREDVQAVYHTPVGADAPVGQRDAGLLAITRAAFDKTGGWDERYHNLLGEKAFYDRIDRAGLRWTDRTTAFITHIMAANNLSKPPEIYNREMDHDAELIRELS